MPAGYLHQRCAEIAAARAGLSPEPAAAFVLGAQGPDFLFALGIFPLRLSSKPAPFGNTLHERRTGAFLTSLFAAARCGTAAQQAYALGFLTHYALDTTAHPYVYSQSNRPDGSYSSEKHLALEKRWDARKYRADGRRGAPVWLPGVREAEPYWREIAAIWAGAADRVFPEEGITESLIQTALSDSARVCRLTHSPRGVKYGAIWLVERLAGMPGKLTSQMVPRYPRRDADEEIEKRLFEEGVRRAVDLLAAGTAFLSGALDEAAFSAVIGDLGYGTGIQSLP